jgi:outer membrane protein TolC
LVEIWLDLEKFNILKRQIDDRLAVLDPLIGQLEQVARAGIGDVSKVTAAQRTVSNIRVTQTNIYEGQAKAKVEFESAYGLIRKDISYDADFLDNLLPDKIDESLAQKSPLLLSKYAQYKKALVDIAAIKAKDRFNVGLEVRALHPFAGSGYDSDESVGLVASKSLFNGGMLQSEISEAEEIAEAAEAQIEAAYRQGANAIKSAYQSINSMEKAIFLARENAQITKDEIVYLRQQLIIGGSTLDSVLSAEARLYDAESKEVQFRTEKRKAQLLIASVLGLLGPSFDSDPG